MSTHPDSPDARTRRLALVVLLLLASGALAFVGVTGWSGTESPPTGADVPADVTTPTARADATVSKPTPEPSSSPSPPAEAGEASPADDGSPSTDPSSHDPPSPTVETTPEDSPDSSPARSGGSSRSGDSDDPAVDVGGSSTAHGGQETAST